MFFTREEIRRHAPPWPGGLLIMLAIYTATCFGLWKLVEWLEMSLFFKYQVVGLYALCIVDLGWQFWIYLTPDRD